VVVSTVAVEKPSTADELARRLHDAASQKLAVVPVGGGRAEWAEPPNVSTSSYIRRGSTA